MKEYMFLGIMLLILVGAIAVMFNKAAEVKTEPYQAMALDIFKHGVSEPNEDYQLDLEEARQAYLDSEANLDLVKQNVEREIAEAAYRAETTCLAVNIYYEARSQGPPGMNAVAAVTINRVKSPDYPDLICDVVFDTCQFAWVCDKSIEPIKLEELPQSDRKAYNEALRIARLFYDICLGQTDKQDDDACGLLDPTDGAMFYHALYSKPYWTNPEHKFVHTTTLGDHAFYRAPES